MTKKLTFEERLSRLERLMKSRTQKNEFLGLFDKPKRKAGLINCLKSTLH